MVFRHCISKTIAHVELGRMSPAPPIAGERGERGLRLRLGNRDGADFRDTEEVANILFGLLDTSMALSADPQSSLEDGDWRSDRRESLLQQIGKRIGFRLTRQNGHDRRGVDEHHAFPLRSSYQPLSPSRPAARRLRTRSF